MKYLLKISYDGSKFNGFQRLNDQTGVQNEIERVLKIIFKKDIQVKGAGRTDRGVHAYSQYAHFEGEYLMELSKLCYVMNRLLNPYIKIIEIFEVKNDFHARHSVKEKTYVYKVSFDDKNPFLSDYAYIMYQKPNLKKMKKASKLFIGEHNYRNFVSGERDNYASKINSLKIYKKNNFLIFEIKGQSFYRYMVRMIVGALLDVGLGKAEYLDIGLALNNFMVPKTFFVAPPEGLYLANIVY